MTRVAALAAVAFALAACGGGDESPRPQIRVVLDDQMEGRYIEGYLWFAGLDRARRVDANSTLLRGEEGSHELVSYIRACSGTCDRLDPPDHRCSVDVTLAGNAVAEATVRLQDRGCSIILR